MKKTHKKILGFLGILVVVAITAFAITLPATEAQATSSVTDTITVRVVENSPNVDILGINNGEIITSPFQTFTGAYSNVDKTTVRLTYEDMHGSAPEEFLLDEFYADFSQGEKEYDISTYIADSGYGKYTITMRGEGLDNVGDEDTIVFYYLPVTITTTYDKENDKLKVDLDYDTSDNSDVKYVEIKVYDKDGTTVIKEITVAAPVTSTEIDLSDLGLETGNYKVTATAYGENGVALYDAFETWFYYEAMSVPETANTGGLFNNTNISSTDYLITGMVIFGLVAIAGTAYIMRSNKNKK